MQKETDYTSKDYNSAKNIVKDAANTASTLATPSAATTKDISDIRSDLDSLKSNVVALTKHLQQDGKAKFGEVKETVQKGFDTIKSRSSDSLEVLESQVKENPRRALVTSFLAGFVASVLLRRS